MKKKALLSAVLTLAVCLCLIAGSTYALFTSESELNIAVTSGKVEMIANLEDLTIYSVSAKADGEEIDENGNHYEYVEQVDTFANGGTAVFADRVLTLERVTPGDKVSFTITGANNSNVLVQYRYSISCVSGQALMSGMIVTIDDAKYTSLDHYVSAWTELDAGVAMDSVEVSIELPVAAGNEYQDLSTAIYIQLEAVQANGIVSGDAEVGYINVPKTAEELSTALAEPSVSYVTLFEDIEDVAVIENVTLVDKTIDARGNDVALKFVNTTLENVVVTGIVNDDAGRSIDLSGATGDITVTNCTLISGTGTGGTAIGLGANADLTVDNCSFSAVEGKTYSMYNSGAVGSLVITNSTFTGFSSWAIQVNNAVNGELTVSNCTFDTPDGVLKVLNGVEGDFTFTNNTMINCKGHDGNIAKLLVSGSGSDPISCTGTKTVANNTLDGADWAQ